MNPGDTTNPVASMTDVASSVISPTATMRPSFTPTSARRGAARATRRVVYLHGFASSPAYARSG